MDQGNERRPFLTQTMKQIISYSLYGSNPKYLVGAIKNAIIAQKIMKDFTIFFYVGSSVPDWCVQTLSLFENVEIVRVSGAEDSSAMFWRFHAFAEGADYVLVKDADARLSLRDLYAHQEFVESGLNFHIVKDHPVGHNIEILGASFSVKGDSLSDIHELMSSYPITSNYGCDQDFLRDMVYQRAKKSMLVHDSYFKTISDYPSITKEIDLKRLWTLDMIGAALNEDDSFVYGWDAEKSIKDTGKNQYIYNIGD